MAESRYALSTTLNLVAAGSLSQFKLGNKPADSYMKIKHENEDYGTYIWRDFNGGSPASQ